ncbi:mycofactocin oligosaccharide methyltransferase MftM [Rhodococcus sp. G-MC3]|uniref:mycofactocin oligosaccharide methyltransferase MftM n=1 Tax=Rhodococcus sp. G-MC3 TaxID=3046209 RepID=UPI0024B8FDE8|nr:mycofactocin oligosaccharide methyltransferase MftM [Rhodococcus sp. G-MC3]MDJ0392816.1 mycofactocin oligosaccharide methyltransferase MftM [Rhodococcus sp. G-MC3]
MTELDALAPGIAGRWIHEHIVVEFDEGLSSGTIELNRAAGSLTVRHALNSSHLGEGLLPQITAMNLGQREFELVIVGLVRSTVPDPVESWATYYRNSLDDLLSGAADFAPIHERAESLVDGSVLDLGSCFGFFPLRLALRGVQVTATDLSEGTMRLLRTVAPHLGVTLDVITCDAAGIPVADNSADTVTALHLLEHVDDGACIIDEAVRIARRRVIVAVPFEAEATACHGHVRTFDADALRTLGSGTGLPFEVDEHHGGWLVLDTSNADSLIAATK